MDTPHTGVMGYNDEYDKIPTAALSMEDAMMLGRIHDRGERITLNLNMEAKTVGDRWSRNIVSEIKGHQYPDEIVVVGGHIDSWDVGQGAHDDGQAVCSPAVGQSSPSQLARSRQQLQVLECWLY